MSSRDWYSALRPMSCFSQIIGIFPLALKGSVGERKFTPSYATLIYSSIVFVSLITSLCLFTAEIDKKTEKYRHLNILQATMLFGLFLQVFSTLVMFFLVILAKGKLANTINAICRQNEELQKLGIRFNNAAEFRRSCIRLGIIVSIIGMLYSFNFVYTLNSNLRYPLNWISWIYTHLVRMIGTCLFAEIILLLKQQFAAVNEYLRKIIQESRDPSLTTRSVGFRICTRIRSIAMIHRNLCESASTLNQIFSVNMVIGIVFAFTFLTSSLYYIVKEIRNPNRSYFRIVGCIDWGLITYVDIVYMVLVCHMAQNEATQTGKLIHKLNIDEADMPSNTMIQNFSLQLLHGRLAFSAAGLFPLDATLFRMIVGAVTTYLVIMIQFDTVTS